MAGHELLHAAHSYLSPCFNTVTPLLYDSSCMVRDPLDHVIVPKHLIFQHLVDGVPEDHILSDILPKHVGADRRCSNLASLSVVETSNFPHRDPDDVSIIILAIGCNESLWDHRLCRCTLPILWHVIHVCNLWLDHCSLLT